MNRHIIQSSRLTLPRFLLLLSLFSLAACGPSPQIEALQAELDAMRARPQGRIDPLPEIPQIEVRHYHQASARDPFQSSREPVSLNLAQAASGLMPDLERKPEVLENWTLEQLRLSGIIERRGQLTALILAPDRQLHSVGRGDYMGRNHGRITRIDAQGLTLTELYMNAQGQWQERENHLHIAR
ncbi:pilus assembly protein PilP [Marinospirillum sp. MEB164]|uniref:Pilus assembly protein PilP n=1 Tax=Marinospirillum alkalitolerans TaxID=3123374 RepID=A0ABW8PTD9_9GAMM